MDRFWSKVVVSGPDDCWPWTAKIEKKTGYGRFWLRGRNEMAHRVAYQLGNGPIPEGLQVLHKCDNRPCCNPRHLFPGTHQDNMDDRTRKGRQPVQRGEKHGRSRLKPHQVMEMRHTFATGGVTLLDLANRYGVCFQNVSLIVNGKTWKHVGGPICGSSQGFTSPRCRG